MDNAKPIRCKAAVCHAVGEPFRIEEVVVAPPKSHEARIKIICTSVCHSDISSWRRKIPAIFPRIFGHEAIGVVESVGEGVEEVAVGDTVLPVFLANCEQCVDCRSTKSNACSALPFNSAVPGMPRDHTSRFTLAATGEVVHNWLNVSSFSEYTVVDVAHLVKVLPGMPPEKACLLSCGLSTGIGAAWKEAAVEAGSTVVVFGLGGVGLGVVEGARLRCAGRIIGVDINPNKFEIGKKLGLTDYINPKEIGERSISEIIKEMTGGGADYCFECIGLAPLMAEAFYSSRSGWGKTVILGVEKNDTPLAINSREALRGKILIFSIFGGIKAKTDIPLLMKHYLDKELHLDEFITHEVGFSDVNKAFDLMIQGECLKCAIWMDK